VDLTLSQADVVFREEVKAFLEEALTPELKRAGLYMTSVFSDFEASIAWQRTLLEKGWVAPDWPVEYGGIDWTLAQKSIFLEECKKAGAPSLMAMGIQMLGPMLLKYGTQQQKDELLPRILSGEDIWCQGYSEPGAGSDLASLQMKAVADGDDYILNGSKIWTSFAQHSNKIFCLVRTSTEGKPQAGISFLLMDIDLPGITVDPIVSIDGEVEQCQVFFEDVRVPKTNLVGEENQGWGVAKYLLEFERGGYSYYVALNKQLKMIKQLAAEEVTVDDVPYRDDPVFANRLAELEVDKLALEFVEHRIKATLLAGGNPGALSSMTKVVGTELSQQLDELALELRGNYLAPLQNHVLAPSYQGETLGSEAGISVMNSYLNNRAATIYGGTAQVQRNIIAKLVLGL
jgi:alkylation response protein AidB-like acyl-CoA dehydrogenase